MLSDAHIHRSPFAWRYLAENDTLTVISCASPEECAAAEALSARHSWVHTSCGIHPWYVDKTDPQTMAPWLEKTSVIGEIGMDNLWCNTDLALQRERFEAQLAFASSRHKPVVLHTKGMEADILSLIRRYPNTYHVHWYSGDEGSLDGFLALDCYMSIGPFPSLDPAVAAVARRVPSNRLLIETDGIDAVRWAVGSDVSEDRYDDVLRQIARETAQLRGTNEEAILALARENLQRFLSVQK